MSSNIKNKSGLTKATERSGDSDSNTRNSNVRAASSVGRDKSNTKNLVSPVRSSTLKKNTTVQRVLPAPNGWQVRTEKSGKVLEFKTKREAIDAAKSAAHSDRNLIIHGKSGQVFQRAPVSSSISDRQIRQVIRAVADKQPPKSQQKAPKK
jgi:hypothetical protein